MSRLQQRAAGTVRLFHVLVVLAWMGNFIYALGVPGGALEHVGSAMVATALLIFFIRHGSAHLGGRGVVTFSVIVCVTAWLFEAVGIVWGLPFGQYVYTDLMRPFLVSVPVFVLLAYVLIGYLAWTMAAACWSTNGAGAALLVPLTAALLMVGWDIAADPLRSSMENRWIWLQDGAYHGVPLVNFLGWFLVTGTMFLVFAATPPGRASAAADAMRVPWAAPLLYLSFTGEYFPNGIIAAWDPEGEGAHSALKMDTALAALLVMVPMAVFCLLRGRSAAPAARQAAPRDRTGAA